MTLSADTLYKHKKEIELDIHKMELQYAKTNTNHILHLLLSMITVGFWLIVWFVIANSNARRRVKLEKLISESKSALIDINQRLIPNAIAKEKNANGKITVECPWCAEEILEKAVICKHCGRRVKDGTNEEK